ncbi:MAG: dienelactone hydrolase family protein [Thermoplasmatales archaeon]|nr:dienelactone hydrolase family protein [Thermoplasmatales archaeon]MCW6170580.1 dienelactone hydrolase family protein [Thermoplasmatales archaeon]
MVNIKEENTTYKTFDNTEVKSFIARPDDEQKHPAILVIQEIWGLTDFIKSVASRLTREGFVAMAPHLYSRPGQNELFTPENIMDAMRPMWSLPPEKRGDQKAIQELLSRSTETTRRVVNDLMFNRKSLEEAMVKDLIEGYKFIRGKPFSDDKTGVIGFCMGGGLAFQISTIVPFQASMIYYGANPKNIDDLGNLSGPVFGVYAGDDSSINAGLPDLIKGMLKHKKDLELKIYPNTKHAFFNDTGMAYDENASKDVWPRTLRFFKQNLGE